MKRLSDLAVGDEVLILHTYRPGQESVGTVVKVARVWITVQTSPHRVEKFRLETGHDGGDPSHRRIVTRDMRAEEEERASISKALRDAGVSFTRSSHLSTAALKGVLELVTAHD